MTKTVKMHLKDTFGNVVKTINVTKENRIITSSPRFHVDEIKNGNFQVLWSSGLLDDLDFKDIVSIDIER